MARLSLGQKADRITRFLLALRNPVICEVMQQHGFTRDDLREGSDLVARVAGARFARTGSVPATDPEIVSAVDAWENKWFPIIDATLSRHFPEIREAVFLNLAQTSGPEVLYTVRALVERIESLPASKADGGFGREGAEARELLVKRGVTTQLLAGVKSTIDMLGQPATPREVAVATPEDDAELEKQMWAWYLEWSTIARAAIKDRRLLKTLGFLQAGRGKDEAASDEPTADDAEPTPPRAS